MNERDFARLRPQIIAARDARRLRPKTIEPVGPDEESVWDFPRPPAVETVSARMRVEFAGSVVADTRRGLRIIETAGAPVYYFPPDDVRDDALRPVAGGSLCEWKGVAQYFDLALGERRSSKAAFCYPDPIDDLGRGFVRIAGWIAFYAGRVDAAWLGHVRAEPQPGGYYAGWVAPGLRGPIKGEPGSEGW